MVLNIKPLITIKALNREPDRMLPKWCSTRIVISLTNIREVKTCFLLFLGKLSKFEIPAAIKLVKEEWLPETGLITTSFKLKRKDIQEYYKDDIQKLYCF